MPSVTPTGVAIRAARSADAPSISALYEEAYQPADGGSARDHYPFPQFLDPAWVGDAVLRPDICWVIAESGGNVVGSAGMVRNIGAAADQIGEVFGIVVAGREWGRGIGSGLLQALCCSVPSAEFIICESRTALASGINVARKCGFAPIGFEPFAHSTPAGSESMLLTGRSSRTAACSRAPADPASPRVCALAEAVLGPLQLPAPPVAPDASGALWPAPAGDDGLIAVVHDNEAGQQFLQLWADHGRHDSGVVCLSRMEGQDSDNRRFDPRYYVGRSSTADICCARVVWDRIDRRARLLDFQSRVSGVERSLFQAIVRVLAQEASAEPLVVVVDVRADALQVQVALEQLGFVPTVYYPGLIARGAGRGDAVQYTCLFHRHFPDSLGFAEELDWPSARGVVARVGALFDTAGVPGPPAKKDN